MSVLAVYLEKQGIATVVVGLIRPHLEKITPPRALWVPFELGRPLAGWVTGSGEDAEGGFQLKVLRKALSLLDNDSGAPVLEDFDLEDPSTAVDKDWQAPSMDACKTVRDEVQYLYTDWNEWQQKNKGSNVGLSGMEAVSYTHLTLPTICSV